MLNAITAAFLEAIYILEFQEHHPEADFAPITILQATRRTTQFAQLADLLADLLAAQGVPDWKDYWDQTQAGYDLYLSAAGHGTGFWDRYTDPTGIRVGEILDQLAKILGDPEAYLGDDGLIYFDH